MVPTLWSTSNTTPLPNVGTLNSYTCAANKQLLGMPLAEAAERGLVDGVQQLAATRPCRLLTSARLCGQRSGQSHTCNIMTKTVLFVQCPVKGAGQLALDEARPAVQNVAYKLHSRA